MISMSANISPKNPRKIIQQSRAPPSGPGESSTTTASTTFANWGPRVRGSFSHSWNVSDA